MKFLVLAIVLALAWWLLWPRLRTPRPPRAAGRPPAPQVQAMLSCARCGLHLPRSEAVFDAEGRPFCSEAHLRVGAAARPPA